MKLQRVQLLASYHFVFLFSVKVILFPTVITTEYPVIASLVHMLHSLSVQTFGPVSLVHMPDFLLVQSSYSAYPPPHTLQVLAALLVCLVLA